MRWFLFFVLIVAILALVGVITFNHSPGKESIEVNTQKLDKDVHQTLNEGQQILKNVEQHASSKKTTSPENSPTGPANAPNGTANAGAAASPIGSSSQ